MKKVISLITVILLLACMTVSASADASWFNGLQLTSQIQTINGNLPTYCNGSIVFNAKHVDSNIEVSISCRSYDSCLLENVITQKCLSKHKCVVDYGYCTNGNYNYNNNGNGSNGENGNGNNNDGNNNNNNTPPKPPEEKPKIPELKDLWITATTDTSNIQIKANTRYSESSITESVSSQKLGDTQLFNINFQSISDYEYEYWTPWLPFRLVKLNVINNRDYPIRLYWSSNAVKGSNMIVSSWVADGRGFNERFYEDMYGNIVETPYVGSEIFYNGGNTESGYVVIPAHSQLKDDNVAGTYGVGGVYGMIIYFSPISRASANATIDFFILKDFEE